MVPSSGTRVLFDSDGNGKFGRFFSDILMHAWPSQMHSNLLISGVKILAIVRVLTLLINKFSYICEGQSWWVRITSECHWQIALWVTKKSFFMASNTFHLLHAILCFEHMNLMKLHQSLIIPLLQWTAFFLAKFNHSGKLVRATPNAAFIQDNQAVSVNKFLPY